MPLPESGAPWPPRQWTPYCHEMGVNTPWHNGDARRLARLRLCSTPHRAAPPPMTA